MRIKRNEWRGVRAAWIGFRPTQSVLLASTSKSILSSFAPPRADRERPVVESVDCFQRNTCGMRSGLIYLGVRFAEIGTTRSVGDPQAWWSMIGRSNAGLTRQ